MKKTILLCLLLSGICLARQGTWNGGTTDGNLITNWTGLSGAIASGDTLTLNSGSTNCTFSATVTCNKIVVTSGYTGTLSTASRTINLSGGGLVINGTATYSNNTSTLNLGGVGDSLLYASGITLSGTTGILNVNARSCVAVLNKSTTFATITLNNASLTIDGSSSLSLGAAATNAIGTSNNSRITINVALTIVRTTTGSPWSWTSGDTINGTGAWTIRSQKNLPAITYTGSGAWTLTETSTTAHNDSLTGNVNIGTAAFTSGKSSTGKCALHLNGYTLTCGTFNQTNTNATDTNFTYIGTGTLNCSSKIPPTSVTGVNILHLGTGTTNCSTVWRDSAASNEFVLSGATSRLNAGRLINRNINSQYGYLKIDTLLTSSKPFKTQDSSRVTRVATSGGMKWSLGESKATRILSYTAGDFASGDSLVSNSPGTKCTLIIGGLPSLTGVYLSGDVVYADTGSGVIPPSVIMTRHYQNRQIIQRNHGQRYRRLALSGSCAGSVRKIKAILYRYGTTTILDSATIDTVLTGGSYTSQIDTLQLPTGNWYRIKIQGIDSTNTVVASDSSNQIACGMVFGLWGYSAQEGTDAGHGYTVADSAISLYDTLRTWGKLNDPIGSAWENINGATIAPTMGNKIWQTDSMPVGFVLGALSGSSLTAWCVRLANHFDTTNPYGRAASYLKTAVDSGICEGVVFTSGIYEARDGWAKQRWIDSAVSLRNHVKEDIDTGITFYITGMSPRAALDTVVNVGDTAFSLTRLAQQALDSVTGFKYAGAYWDLPTTDGIHPTRLSQDTVGNRVAQTILYGLGRTSFYRSPLVSAITDTINQNVIKVNFTNGTINNKLTTNLVTGKKRSDGSWIQPDSARGSGSTLKAYFSSPVFKINYGLKVNPDTANLLRSNSTPSLPVEIFSLGVTTNFTPTILSVTPNHGKTSQGDTVEIRVAYGWAIDTVWFQNDFVIPFSITDSLVKCEAPAHAPTTVNISVHDTNGYVDTLFSAYEYNNLYGWHVTHPASLDTAGGDTIKFHSEYGQATEATVFTFDGSVVALTTNTDTLSTYITPAHAKGSVPWIFDAMGTVKIGSVRYRGGGRSAVKLYYKIY